VCVVTEQGDGEHARKCWKDEMFRNPTLCKNRKGWATPPAQTELGTSRDPLDGRTIPGEVATVPNFFSAFTSEVFRPLVTLLIPGAIAISTWFAALMWHFPDFRTLVYKNHTETGLTLFLAMTFAGLVLEDLGAHAEAEFDSIRNEDGKHLDNWYAYLRTAFNADPIGRRYVRTLVLRLKFELGVAFGSLSAGIGILWFWYIGLGGWSVLVGEFLCISFAAYGFYEGWSTHYTLAINRANLLEEVRIVPPAQASTETTGRV